MRYRFRIHRSDLSGTPDIVLLKHQTVIFVHGCFWHGHNACDKGTRRPKTNKKFWEDKLRSNIERHARVVRELVGLGWQTLTIWECEVRDGDLEFRLGQMLRKETSHDA
jgi:DNA mismatch endonuclease (patch repair protein)